MKESLTLDEKEKKRTTNGRVTDQMTAAISCKRESKLSRLRQDNTTTAQEDSRITLKSKQSLPSQIFLFAATLLKARRISAFGDVGSS